MAKEKGKKASGELNAEELENVAGGMCLWGGISVPPGVKDSKKTKGNREGTYEIVTTLKSGQKLHSVFGSEGIHHVYMEQPEK